MSYSPEHWKKYYKKNREKVLKYWKKYRQEKGEELVKYKHQYYQENKVRLVEIGKKWEKDNKESHLKFRRRYYQKNKHQWDGYYRENRDSILKMRVLYGKEHRKEKNEWHQKRRKTDIGYVLNRAIRSGIRQSLKGSKNGRQWESLVGYNIESLKRRLTRTMPKGYTWQSYFEGLLHIDHKIPISVFNFTQPEHIDFKRCWALKNLQLLPAKENLRKSAKLTKPFQPSLAL